MTVKEICTEYSKLGNETLKKQCLNKIKITPYVPVLRKRRTCWILLQEELCLNMKIILQRMEQLKLV